METLSTAATPGTSESLEALSSAHTNTHGAFRPASLLRRLAASGTGLAIAIDGDNLDILLLRVRPSQVSVVAYQRFVGVKERPAAELGSEYARFLRKNGVPHLAASVLLPREELIVRTLALPGVPQKDLEAAITLQLETLHPYLDDDVRFGFVRIGNTPQVMVGICRESVVDRWIAYFEDAGIKLAAFTFSADVLYRALRSLRVPPAGFVTAFPCANAVEIYGESPARPLYNAMLYAEAGPALEHARSELRLTEEASSDLSDLLPAPATVEQAEFANAQPLLYATALSAAATFSAPGANLLPTDLRKGKNWVVILPTLIILGILAMLVAGMYTQRAWNEREYAQRLLSEIQLLERQVAQGQRMDDEGERFLARIEQLKEYKLRTGRDLAALLELTRLLPEDAWVTQLDLGQSDLTLAGEANQAGSLVKTIDGSPLFENSEFSMPLQRLENREIFRLRVKREAQK